MPANLAHSGPSRSHLNYSRTAGTARPAHRARIADGEERSRLWARADDVNQGQYTIYQSRTKRAIPVVVLEARWASYGGTAGC